MKRARLTLVVAVAIGLFSAIPAIAQTTVAANADELGIAITINKLDLTPTQMQQVHDILAGVLSEATALTDKKDAFTQEMIRFTGSSTDLETALTNFKSQLVDQTQAFQQNVKQALVQLKGILTIEQGEILRGSFLKGANFGLEGKLPVGMGPRSPAMKPGDQEAAPNGTRMERQLQDQRGHNADNQDNKLAWMEQMMADHPEFANRMAQRFGNMSQQQDQTAARRPVARFQSLQDGKTLVGKRDTGALLDALQKVVDILGTKLQYVKY
jgi:hypothetical protein